MENSKLKPIKDIATDLGLCVNCHQAIGFKLHNVVILPENYDADGWMSIDLSAKYKFVLTHNCRMFDGIIFTGTANELIKSIHNLARKEK